MIHVYQGDGKGKTTAAMGLVLRAVAAGWQVVVVQFLKGAPTGEVSVLESLPGVTVLRGKNSKKFSFQMDEAELAAANDAHNRNLLLARDLCIAGNCDLLVLDESLGALTKGILDEALVRELLALASPGAADGTAAGQELELVLTGRGLPDFIEETADYITEMRCIRHPYENGIHARKGVEF